jgi:hypothetical protein
MSFSVGILYSSQRLLKLVHENILTLSQLQDQFKKFYVASSKYVIDLCKTCGWIEINSDGYLQVTRKGQEVLLSDSVVGMLRLQLKHYIYTTKPSWSRVLHYGRKEAFQYFPNEVKQCFEEAELLSNYDDSTINWWDTLGAFSRRGIEEQKISIGRKGEHLSIEFERKRVGLTPIWKSIDSNFVGYDILSKVSIDDASNLNIEVKTTSGNSDKIIFYITENEWNVATMSENYVFHIWSLHKEPVLYILEPEFVGNSIPLNRGSGIWENVRIEFTRNELEAYKIVDGGVS